MARHVFTPFDRLSARITREGIERWANVENAFLRAVEKFDEEFAAEKRTPGWYKAKARYFNDLVILLLQNWSSMNVVGPVHRDSQLFHEIDIDICFPAEGVPRAAAEVKALGTPGHPGNNNVPRPGSRDLHKRVREVAFTSTDLKAAYAKPTQIRTFNHWIQNTEPAYFSFWAVRVEDQKDFESVRSILVGLSRYCNGVGAIIYEPAPSSTQKAIKYRPKKVPELGMDQALRQMAQFMT